MFLGIDVGTTNVKAGVLSEVGRLLSVAREPTPTLRPQARWAEHPADELWACVVRVCRRAMAGLAEAGDARERGTRSAGGGPAEAGRLGTVRLEAVGIAGMAEAGLLIDAHGEPLTPLLAWFDGRGEHEAKAWLEPEVASRTWLETGVLPSTKVPLIKLQWLARHRPAALESAWKWLHAPDFVAYRLTGEAATSPSLACRTMAFSLLERKWSAELLSRAGIDASIMPFVVDETSAVGRVSALAASQLGLPEGIPVVIAGHDHACGAAGAGVDSPSNVLDSLGTAETLLRPLEHLGAHDSVITEAARGSRAAEQSRSTGQRSEGYNYGCRVSGGYYEMAGLSSSGGTFAWWASKLRAGRSSVEATPRPESDGPSGQDLQEVVAAGAHLASLVTDRPSGLLALPYLDGSGPPQKDPVARGALLGLHRGHNEADLLLAVIEGLACESRRMLEGMGALPEEVTAIGGGTGNEIWLQTKADVMNLPIRVPATSESVLVGAGTAAAIATGHFSGFDDVGREEGRVVLPHPERSLDYDDWFRRVYRPAVEAYRELDALVRSGSGVGA